MLDPVRLCVSGLAPGVTPSELEARFHTFGSVLSCEMIAPKVYDGVEFHRGFAYVVLTPKDQTALANCLAVYNGCKWRGGVLRCTPARPDYRERLRLMQSNDWETSDVEVGRSGMQSASVGWGSCLFQGRLIVPSSSKSGLAPTLSQTTASSHRSLWMRLKLRTSRQRAPSFYGSRARRSGKW